VHRRVPLEAEEADRQGDEVQPVGEWSTGSKIVLDQPDPPALLLLGPRLDSADVGQQRLLVALVGQEDLQEHDMTVAAWIRSRRLDRCRRDLADPGLWARPVSAIGARWGFPDGAHFSRVFRAAYGIPPREYRRRAARARAVNHLCARRQ
jgi:hypothetical protein